MQRGIFIWILFFLLILAGCGKTYTNSSSGNSSASEVKYGGSFMVTDSTESSTAYGSVTATFNIVSHALDYTISWHSLTTSPVGMHFHDAGPIIIKINNFPVALDGTVSGSAVLSSNQADDLAAGSIYAMIHSQKYPNGEIMAYLFKQ
jgi:CHRD domain-containing protein